MPYFNPLKKLRRIFVVFVFLVILSMWLKEASERRSRQAADKFMGPTLEFYEWLGDSMVLQIQTDSKGRKYWPTWRESYESRHVFGEPLSLDVDCLGNVRRSDNQKADYWISLSDEEREKQERNEIYK